MERKFFISFNYLIGYAAFLFFFDPIFILRLVICASAVENKFYCTTIFSAALQYLFISTITYRLIKCCSCVTVIDFQFCIHKSEVTYSSL